MTEIIKFPEKVTTDEYFGGCPTCGKSDGYLNIGRDHWMVCHKHKTRWLVGSNLFSSWRDESEEDWDKNTQLMAGYAKVDPIDPVSPPIVRCERCEAETVGYRQFVHSPLCQDEDGTLTDLPDDQVRSILGLLHQKGFYIAKNDQVDTARLPF